MRTETGKEAVAIRTQPIIYLDVLLSVNLFVNYFLLLTASKFLGVPYKKYRLLLGALLGALFSLVILLPSIPFLLNSLLKIPMSAAMVVVAYPLSGWRAFVKRLSCLYAVSFSFAGLMLAISYCLHPSGLVIKNAAVYVAVSPMLLVLATVICYFAVTLLYRITGKHHLQHTFCIMEIWRQGQKVQLTVKIDTGNSLTEPFSGLPVAVVERSAVADLLSRPVCATTGQQGVFSGDLGWDTDFRMVPFDTLSGQGLLPSFRPEKCVIRYGKEEITTRSLYIGVSEQKMNGGDWQGLLHPAILSGGTSRPIPQNKGKIGGR